MTSIADVAVNSELMTFVNDPQSDSTCGLSPMLAWAWPDITQYNALASSARFWPTTSTQASNPTGVNIAITTINNKIANSSSLPTDGTLEDLTTVVLDTTVLFSFAMLYNQLAKFQGVTSVSTSDRILVICTEAVAAASAASVIPCADATTNLISLQSSLASATDAVRKHLAALPSADAHIQFVSSLATLIPRMFTPCWTLNYFASFGDGRMPNTSFYDQRYAPLAVASAFDNWLQYISTAGANPHMLDIISWLSSARGKVTSTTEGQSSMSSNYRTIRGAVQDTSSRIQTLQATIAQFERRRGSVGAMSENLSATRKRTDLAFTTLVVWLVTLVFCLVVAGFLIQQKDYRMVLVLIFATTVLLTVDALGRGVAAAGAGAGAGAGTGTGTA